ncbi:hypothetical protein QOZ80_3BG0278950 [Eleusine coracana subsp. coracana]|nr:hypothetical protein QOZ80_3BG0278950 [Eleusine coracana subsp. coracana]
MEFCLLDAVFFARPSTGAEISGSLDFVSEGGCVLDHRNGLLLYKDDGVYFVVNPATRQYARLPPPRINNGGGNSRSDTTLHLVFDPSMPPHYEVFVAPPPVPWYNFDLNVLQSQWPSSSYTLQAFSSVTGRWVERMFTPEEETRLFVPERDVTPPTENRERRTMPMLDHHSVYWRGALYVPWHHNFVMR